MQIVPVSLSHYLVLGSLLFAIGMYGALTRRNGVAVLLALELMLNGVNVVLVAFARFIQSPQPLAGHVWAIFTITLAAAEAAIGLAIVLAIYRLRRTVQVDKIDLLKG